jgi:hypothetical protein
MTSAIGPTAIGNRDRAICDRVIADVAISDVAIGDVAICDVAICDRAICDRAIGDRAIGDVAISNLAKWGVVALAIVGSLGCELGRASAPVLAGPSEFGVSVALAAAPDLLPRDGRAVSTISVTARDGAAKPVANVAFHLELQLDGGTGGLGTLSQSDVVTGANGVATATYTSPLPAPLGQADDAVVRILVRPVGTNAVNAANATVSVRLTSVSQAGGPTASFILGPTAPKVGDTILFDASASQPSTGASIVAFAWDFGDGNASPRVPYLMSDGPTITHEYNKSGPFTVGLTIIDSNGKRATASIALVVAQ